MKKKVQENEEERNEEERKDCNQYGSRKTSLFLQFRGALLCECRFVMPRSVGNIFVLLYDLLLKV